MSLHQKLMTIQSTLKAPKEQYNSFGKYFYRNCEDILEALKPLMLEQKCVVTLSDDIIMLGDRYYVRAIATLIDADGDSGEHITNIAYAREEDTKKGMDGSQITGAASSYARKYALNGLFGIDDAKDSDTTNSGDNGQATKQDDKAANQKGLTPDQVSQLQQIITDAGKDVDLICKSAKVASLADLSQKQYDGYIKMFSKR